ncbi:MAG: tetratricopeptide repeat protein [Cyclobacteriaceae bacterium]
MKKFCFLYNFICLSLMANNPTDSLKTTLRFAKNDTIKVEILLQLAEIQQEYSYRDCVSYAKNALDLSRDLGFPEGEAKALRILGTVNWASSNYGTSRNYLDEAIQIFDNLEDNYNQGRCYNTIGLSFYYQASYPIAIENLTHSLEIFTVLKDSAQIARVSNNLALVYEATGKFELANKFFISGLNHKLSYRAIYDQFLTGAKRQERIYKNERTANVFIPELRANMQTGSEEGDFYKVAASASKIGAFYSMLSMTDSALHYLLKAGSFYDSLNEPAKYALELLDIAKCYSKLGQNKKAEEYFDLALPILIEEQMNPTVGSWHNHLGNHLVGIGDHRKAIRVFQSGLTHSDSLGHLASSVRYYRLLSGIYYLLSEFTNAIEHGQIALEIADSIGSFTQRKEAIEKLYLAYRASGDLANAIKYQDELHRMNQLKESASTQRASQEFEAKFEHQIQAQQIDALTKENQLKDSRLNTQLMVIYFSILFITTVVIFFLILRNRHKKTRLLNQKVTKQNDALAAKNSENELLIKEIHHRVKNNLQIVSSILGLQQRRTENKETKSALDNTKSRVGVMGLIHEHLYKTDDIALVSLDQYVPDLVDRLCSSLHDGNEINVEYDILSEKIDLDATIYIGLITHEVVVNAIKYAFSNNPNPYLRIEIHLNKEGVVINFTDNGPGMQESMDGFGWTIIQSIVKNMEGTIDRSNSDGFDLTIMLKNISLVKSD